MKRRIAFVFGTRPEAIKLAPVINAAGSFDFEPVVIVTAQHRNLLDQVLGAFDIRPVHDLSLFEHGQGLIRLTGRALEGLGPVLDHEAPDMVVVQGDTTTTMSAALASFYAGIPVAHVEAGLRTYDPRDPFPEEMNRRVTTALTSLHFPPTPTAKEALLREGVPEPSILVSGNTVIDALRFMISQDNVVEPEIQSLCTSGRRLILITMHRRESWGARMVGISSAIAALATQNPDDLFVFPVHPNPRVRDAVTPHLGELPNVRLIEPVDYPAFVSLLAASYLVMTDSGGIQEEAPSLAKPVLVLRNTTERPEAVAAGTARLVGTDPGAIVDAASILLDDECEYRKMSTVANPYGDGSAAPRIVQGMLAYLAGAPLENPFVPGA